MPKISDEELTKVLCRFWKRDYDAVLRMATTEVPAAQIIREALAQFVRAAEARARRTIDNFRPADPSRQQYCSKCTSAYPEECSKTCPYTVDVQDQRDIVMTTTGLELKP